MPDTDPQNHRIVPEPREGTLERAAGASFLLLAAALPWSVAPISIAVVLCALLTLAVWWRPGGPRWTATPVDLPALCWIAALVLASVFAVDSAGSWPRVKEGLLLGMVAVAAYHARVKDRARRAVATLFVSAGAAALFALARFAAEGPAFPNRVRGLVGHPLTYGGQAMLLAVFAISIGARVPGGWRRGALVLLAIVLPALAGTYTRSAWIGTLAAAAIVAALTRPRWLLALPIVVALFVVAMPGAYRERALSILDPGNPWNRERVHMWDAGLRMLRDHPWTGVGLQDLHPLYERYKAPGALEPAGHLHNAYVQVGATMGVIGLAALAGLIWGLTRAAWRGYRGARDAWSAAAALGALAGLVGFFVSGLMEWNLGDEELLNLLCFLVGIGFASAAASGVSPSSPSSSGADTTPPGGPDPPAAARAVPGRGRRA